MGYIVLDGNAVTRLESVRGSTEIRDLAGRVIGVFEPAVESISPQLRAELESRRANRSGRRLDEVLKELPRS